MTLKGGIILKRQISVFLFIFMLINCINVFATPQFTVQLTDKDAEPLLPRVNEDEIRYGYLFDFNGEQYIVGRGGRYTLPMKKNDSVPFNFDIEYLWTGKNYMVRYKGYDGFMLGENIPVLPVGFYDTSFSLIADHQFESNINSIGYFDDTYYCKLRNDLVYKSTDMVNWERTDEDVPFHVGNVVLEGDKVAFQGKPLTSIKYENGVKKDFWSTMGSWMVKVDNEYNFYLSNDNIYFVKIQMPICPIDHDGGVYLQEHGNLDGFMPREECTNLVHKEDFNYLDLKCLYEYGDDIIVDMKHMTHDTILRLSVQKQEIYDELSQQKEAPHVQLNGNILGFEQPPVIDDGRTLVPMRFLFEQMGAQVMWNDGTQTATVIQNGQKIEFKINDKTAKVNDVEKTMDVPARLVGDKTMVPLRFLSEGLGYTVAWDDESCMAIIEQ